MRLEGQPRIDHMGHGAVSNALAKVRIRDALAKNPDADVRLISVCAQLSLPRTVVLLEGLERSGYVELYSPEPGVRKARVLPVKR